MTARLSSALAMLAALAVAGSAVATAAQTDAVSSPAELQAQVDAHRAELDAITRDIAVSQERQAELSREIDSLDRDRAALNQNLIDTQKDVQRLEDEVGKSEQRLSALLSQEDKLKASLADRRGVLADVLAALQRMGDHPPPALLVRPEDALAAVRSALLLGAVVPNVRAVADQLAQDLTSLVAVRTGQERERDRLKSDATALAEGKARMALLLDDKARQRDSDAVALGQEQARVSQLASQAANVRDLIQRLESAKPVAAAAAAAAPAPLAPDAPRPRSLGNAGRLAPAVAFADAKGLLPMPASGRIITNFGDPNGVGGRSQGVSLTTRPGAEISSPADGWVAYAGEFRSYGQLLIINAGGGYHVVLAGMERIDVQLGQFVLAGEPVAAMASQRLASAGATLVGTTEPVLYVEFRKDGASIDPAPWWTASNPEKVGG